MFWQSQSGIKLPSIDKIILVVGYIRKILVIKNGANLQPL